MGEPHTAAAARHGVVALMVAAALTACGEPAVDVDIPDRAAGEHVVDLADVLSEDVTHSTIALERAENLDVVVLTFETEQAGCGEAFRAGRELVDAWDADVAVVAVARPGDFTSTDDDRERCVGVQPRDDSVIDGALRERIAEEVVPPLAATNDWDAAITAAVEALSEG